MGELFLSRNLNNRVVTSQIHLDNNADYKQVIYNQKPQVKKLLIFCYEIRKTVGTTGLQESGQATEGEGLIDMFCFSEIPTTPTKPHVLRAVLLAMIRVCLVIHTDGTVNGLFSYNYFVLFLEVMVM